MARQNEEGLFSDSLKEADNVNYLGSSEVLDSLLEFWSAEFIERLQKKQDAKKVAQSIASRLSRILLGRVEGYSLVRKWNEPGGIDVFCKDLFKFRDKTPAAVMYHTFLTFFDGLLDLVIEAAAPDFLEETWQTKRKQLITKYTYILRGMQPAQVLTYLTQSEQQSEQQPNQ